eukprot:912562-Prorocentrum_minimum.AAC.4
MYRGGGRVGGVPCQQLPNVSDWIGCTTAGRCTCTFGDLSWVPRPPRGFRLTALHAALTLGAEALGVVPPEHHKAPVERGTARWTRRTVGLAGSTSRRPRRGRDGALGYHPETRRPNHEPLIEAAGARIRRSNPPWNPLGSPQLSRPTNAHTPGGKTSSPLSTTRRPIRAPCVGFQTVPARPSPAVVDELAFSRVFAETSAADSRHTRSADFHRADRVGTAGTTMAKGGTTMAEGGTTMAEGGTTMAEGGTTVAARAGGEAFLAPDCGSDGELSSPVRCEFAAFKGESLSAHALSWRKNSE